MFIKNCTNLISYNLVDVKELKKMPLSEIL